MSTLIAIPVIRISCRVAIDKGRGWSAIEELILWSMTRQSKTVSALVSETRLPPQIIFAAIYRLMRFRLIDVAVGESASFRASEYGFEVITSGKPLPVFPKRYTKHVGFVIERVSGEFYHRRDVTVMSPYRLDTERANGAEIRTVNVEGGGPSMSHDANLRRLSDIAARGWNEEIAVVDGRTADVREDEFMIVRVVDGVPQGLPESAGSALRTVVDAAAALRPGTEDMRVRYAGRPEATDDDPVMHSCIFAPADLVIGGTEQRGLFVELIGKAQRRMIIHSTFLDAARFEALMEPIRAACQSGVTFDLLWGAEKDEITDERSATAAAAIARIVREDPITRGRFRVHPLSTGSHAKFLFLDTEHGWLAAVGSCNWLSSPFQSVEFSVVLRDPALLADFATAVQRLIGRRGLADNIATEVALIARDLRRMTAQGGPARMGIVVGELHDQMNREASGTATKRFFIGCHKIGSTARPGALMQGKGPRALPRLRGAPGPAVRSQASLREIKMPRRNPGSSLQAQASCAHGESRRTLEDCPSSRRENRCLFLEGKPVRDTNAVSAGPPR
jgi:cardiolipin synthase A/B